MTDKPQVLGAFDAADMIAYVRGIAPSHINGLEAIRDGRTVVVPADELARLRARVAELEAGEPVAEVHSGQLRWLIPDEQQPTRRRLRAWLERLPRRHRPRQGGEAGMSETIKIGDRVRSGVYVLNEWQPMHLGIVVGLSPDGTVAQVDRMSLHGGAPWVCYESTADLRKEPKA